MYNQGLIRHAPCANSFRPRPASDSNLIIGNLVPIDNKLSETRCEISRSNTAHNVVYIL